MCFKFHHSIESTTQHTQIIVIEKEKIPYSGTSTNSGEESKNYDSRGPRNEHR